MIISDGTVTLTSTTFASNSAGVCNGGGMYIMDGTVTLTSTTFASNSAQHGGGMDIWYGTVTLTSTSFVSNSADDGMVVCVHIYGTVTLTSTTFASNSAQYGGGMYIYGDSSEVTLRQCSFISNTASDQGHAICTTDSPTIAVINTYFSDPNDNNNIYVNTWYNGSPTWKTCSSSSVCTEAPFTGTCSAVDSGNAKLGVKCPCATSNNYECIGCEFKNNVCVICGAGKYNDQSDLSVACKDCGVGKFNNVQGQASCKNCGVGKFNDFRTKQSLVKLRCWQIQQFCKTAVLANSTIWKANRTKQSLVKTAVLANSTIWKQIAKTAALANITICKINQPVKTAVLANSTIWKANRTKQ